MWSQPQSLFYLAVVGDLKGGRSLDKFTSEEKGHIASFLAKLLKLTQRHFCFGFLTDGRIIQVFCIMVAIGSNSGDGGVCYCLL